MIKTKKCGDVTIIKTGRHFGKKVFYYVHCFVLGDTLIDTSTMHVGKELLIELKQRGLSTIINTHHHEDHIGNNLLLQSELGLEIYAHPEAVPLIAKQFKSRQRFYLKFLWNYPQPSISKPLNNTFNTLKNSFQIIHTLGHTNDHICIYEASRKILFSGDLFLGERVKYLRKDEDFNAILSSLHKLKELKIDTIFCGVAGEISNAELALDRKIMFMEEMKRKVLALYAGGMSPANIRKNILGNEGFIYWVSTGHFSKQNLVDSILKNSNN